MKLLKSYNFWIRLVSVVVLLLRVIGAELGFTIDTNLIIDVATIVASVLVVLGVIQVPTEKVDNSKDDENDNGGEFMKSFEKIRQDIITAKEKLSQNFENNEVLKEVTKLLDGILWSSGPDSEIQEFDVPPASSEEVVIETDIKNMSDNNSDEQGVGQENRSVTSQEEIAEANGTMDASIYIDKDVVLNEEGSSLGGVDISQVMMEPEACELVEQEPHEDVEIGDGGSTLQPEVVLSESKENLLKEALRDKIRSVLETEMDEIIAQIFQ